jgi:transposase
MAHQTRFVGIDVSKGFLDIEIWPAGERLQVTNDRPGRAELVRWLKRRSIDAIGLEASGGYERHVFNALLDAGLPARRVNPLRVRQFAKACGILAKNDRLDAHVIARFIATVPQRPVQRNPAAEMLAELVTARRQLCEELTRAQNQAEHATQPVVTRLSKRRATRLRAEILLLDSAIAKAVAANGQIAHKNDLLRSVPGVGPVFAHTLLALMPELGTLTNRQAASLLGVAPFDCESGAFKGQRRIFGGRQPIRDVAYMAALVAGKHNPILAAFRQRLLDAGKKPKVVIVALMRKLITILNAIIKHDQPWAFA